jgi:hypothetical protein
MLDSRLALKIAARLTVVKEFPRHQEAIDAVAEDLIDLTLSCDEIEAERRARAVVEEIRRTWTEWTGESDLIEHYRKRWPVARRILTSDNEVKNYGSRPKIECHVCNDTGVWKPGGRKSTEPYEWCECEAGILLHFEQPDWLRLCNAQPPEKPPEPTEDQLTHPKKSRPVSDDIERALQCVETCPACMEVRKHSHSEYWNHHTRQELAS